MTLPLLALVLRLSAQAPPGEVPPLPDAEREVLASQVGTWEASVESFMAPGAPTVSTALEVDHLECAGRWLVTEFKGSVMGQPFEGHGVLGWDATRKKLVGSWVDSTASGLQTLEEEYDPKARILAGSFEGPDMTGRVVASRALTEWKDDNTRVFTMFTPGVPGKESVALRITYKRKK
jgi:hypothetical protein